MAKKRLRIIPMRGEVYLVEFDPTVGAEIRKTRPAVVIQNDLGNTYSPLTIVGAITSRAGKNLYPTEVLVRKGEGGLKEDSIILLNQLRSVDHSRLLKKVGTLAPDTMVEVDRALEVSLGLINF